MARGNVPHKSYLTCSRGKWRERVTESTPGSTGRTITPDDGKSPYPVFEIVNDYVSGIIRSIEVQEDNKGYGRQWLVTIQDGNEVLGLQFSYDSGYAFAFLSKLPNADVLRDISFHPYFFEEERKARLVLKQDNENIPSYFTKEDPKGFPDFPEGANKDDITVWKIEVMKFLVDYLETNIIDKLPGKPKDDERESVVDTTGTGDIQSDAQRGNAPEGTVPGPGEDDVPPGGRKEIRKHNVDDDDLPF